MLIDNLTEEVHYPMPGEDTSTGVDYFDRRRGVRLFGNVATHSRIYAIYRFDEIGIYNVRARRIGQSMIVE